MSSNNYLAEPITTVNPVIRESDLLSAISTQTTERSGGPPAPGAVLQDDTLGQFIWSSLAGQFLADESGDQLIDESSNVLIG